MKKGWSSFMDRRVKERLVGATILVVFIVAVVPELLSGPRHAVASRYAGQGAEPIRHVTVDLATRKALPGSDDSAADAPNPAAAGGSGQETAPAAPDHAVPRDSEESKHRAAAAAGAASPSSPVPKPVTPAPPDVVRHGWEAQLGSFANRPNAEALERRLRAQGFSTALVTTGTGRALRYRVRVGPVTDRTGAQKTIARLKKAGHSASIAAQ